MGISISLEKKKDFIIKRALLGIIFTLDYLNIFVQVLQYL